MFFHATKKCEYRERHRTRSKEAVRQPLSDMSSLGSTAAEDSNQSCFVHRVELRSETQHSLMDRNPLMVGSVFGSQEINERAHCSKVSGVIGANYVNGSI